MCCSGWEQPLQVIIHILWGGGCPPAPAKMEKAHSTYLLHWLQPKPWTEYIKQYTKTEKQMEPADCREKSKLKNEQWVSWFLFFLPSIPAYMWGRSQPRHCTAGTDRKSFQRSSFWLENQEWRWRVCVCVWGGTHTYLVFILLSQPSLKASPSSDPAHPQLVATKQAPNLRQSSLFQGTRKETDVKSMKRILATFLSPLSLTTLSWNRMPWWEVQLAQGGYNPSVLAGGPGKESPGRPGERSSRPCVRSRAHHWAVHMRNWPGDTAEALRTALWHALPPRSAYLDWTST